MDQERRLITAQSLQTLFNSTNTSLNIVRNVAEFSAHKLEEGDVSDVEDIDTRDPAIVAVDVASQVVRVPNNFTMLSVLIAIRTTTVVSP